MKIAARRLVECVWRSGDIHYRYDAPTDAEEGIAVQRRLQQSRSPSYRREHRVAVTWRRGRCEPLDVSGRIDGLEIGNDEVLLEEFKTTREPPERLHRHAGDLHFAQLRLYAAMLSSSEGPHERYRLRLVYCHPDTLQETAFERVDASTDLAAFLEATCARFALSLARLRRHRRRRDRMLSGLAFPHTVWRSAQRRLAQSVYRAARDGGSVLAEAPTGAGKTLGTLFPALRALGDGHADRIVFLSARGTGQRVVEDTLRATTPDPRRLRAVTVTAKHRICFKGRPICDPDACEFARGYYDRRGDALEALFAAPRTLDRATVEEVARRHCVCPFELSLDGAAWSDVVVCDYNYVFDPVVRLKRLHGTGDDRTVLLVDEAHQLADRVRDALSVRLERRVLRSALRESADPAFARALRGLDRRIAALRRTQLGGARRDGEIALPDPPAGLHRAVEAALEATSRNSRLGLESASPHDTALDELGLTLARWTRAANWYDGARFATLLRASGRELSVELRCLDPSAHIAEVLGEFRAHARFSGTLTPLGLFSRLHGVEDAQTLTLPSPFPPQSLGVFVVPDVSVRHRDRQSTLGRVTTVIETVVRARTGNYLVALPSFEYLSAVSDAFTARNPGSKILCQTRNSTAEERAAFLANFEPGAAPVIGFVVLGGVFSESIDLPGDRLIGMVVVGVGLPPRSLERDCESACLGPWGPVAAYRQPAVSKVVQAAGRIIRTESDRGVLCLVDDRYLAADYRDLLPAHWQPQRVRAAQFPDALDGFWRNG